VLRGVSPWGAGIELEGPTGVPSEFWGREGEEIRGFTWLGGPERGVVFEDALIFEDCR